MNCLDASQVDVSDENVSSFNWVAITRRTGAEVLLEKTAGTLKLPTYNYKLDFTYPQIDTHAYCCNVRKLAKLSSSLFLVECRDIPSTNGSLIVLETGDPDANSTLTDLIWAPITDLVTDCAELLRDVCASGCDGSDRTRRSPWYTFGWVAATIDWVRDQLQERIVDFRQYSVRAGGAVLRVQTTDGALLFVKASTPGCGEAARSRAICTALPAISQKLIASDDERELMLSVNFGHSLDYLCPPRAYGRPAVGYERRDKIHASIVRAWARAQREFAQCPDINTAGFARHDADWFRAHSALLMDTRSQAFVEHSLQLWKASGLPDTLVHGDFALRNVAHVGGEAPFTFFDWRTASIGFALLDLVAAEREFEGAREAYITEWYEGYDVEAVNAAIDTLRAMDLLRKAALIAEQARTGEYVYGSAGDKVRRLVERFKQTVGEYQASRRQQ